MWFLLIVGTKFNPSSCCRSDRVGQVFTSHSGKFGKCRYSPKSCGARRVRQGLNRKEICWSKYDTHKIKWTNRVRGKNLILNLWAGLDGSPGLMTVQEKLATIQQNRARK